MIMLVSSAIIYIFLASENLPVSGKPCLKTYCVCDRPEEKGRSVNINVMCT